MVSGSRPASCGFEGVWPVASVWVDEVLAEDFSGGEFGDGGVVDEEQDPLVCVFCADSEVVHFSCPAEGYFSAGVDAVDADSVVGGVAEGSGGGFQGRVVCVFGCLAAEGSVGSFRVVGVLEFGELGLELGDGCSGWSGVEPAFLGLVEPLDFPLGLGVTGGPVFLSYAECGEEVFEAVAAAGEAGGVNTSVVSQCGRWQAVVVSVVAESVDDNVAGDSWVGMEGEEESGVVIKPVDDLNISPVGEAPVGEIRLPTFVGLVGFESNV